LSFVTLFLYPAVLMLKFVYIYIFLINVCTKRPRQCQSGLL
jgi:hypothetical protein